MTTALQDLLEEARQLLNEVDEAEENYHYKKGVKSGIGILISRIKSLMPKDRLDHTSYAMHVGKQDLDQFFNELFPDHPTNKKD